ncbi:hypothetical protein JOF53_003830 [Crossiella equi]|uniref:FtsK domain-containing protein n=1 Tax=Crossiella equi TaxID=130796 RepID=A0ABS5AED6_9PSEU|nr:FtsK/SpoIIIE domain-containing protein [Crossiella equi]MBP2474958.1 hypothetical protein [Crossiella equi]
MSKKVERRARISEVFDEFHDAVAMALGAAEQEQRVAAAEHSRAEFELTLRKKGVRVAQQDPEFAAKAAQPALKPLADAALAQHEKVFADWTGDGPATLAELVAENAPGSAGAPWESWLGVPGEHDGAVPAPGLWRVGSARIEEASLAEEFPAAVPFLDHSHLHVISGHETRLAAEALVEALVLRTLSYYQPGLVQVHVWDTGQFTGSLPGLYPLARAGLLTVHDPSRLQDLLSELSEHIRRVHTRILVDGHPSLRALTATTGKRSEPWRIAVLFGNHEALDEALRQQLQRVARNGLACGIQLVMVDMRLSVNSPLETIDLQDPDRVTSSMTGEHAVITLDEPLPRDRVPAACGAIADALLERRSRVCTFADLMPEQHWTESSAEGLSAPIGRSDGQDVLLHLGDASPHALIGGPSGSGKTNFLYAVLGSLTARYSPDELELYVLDFKEGVSFAQFTPGRKDPSWLPHARLVGVNVNTDREFGLALLKYLAEEMRKRAAAAKQHEVTKLEELRAEDPAGRWPRIVAVIDEFQFLFAERDAVTNQAASLLEDVARRGRSQGIHLVLSSQDVSGIEAFWGKPAIFEQFIVRIALPKARRVLVDTNQAAIEIPRRHAVINHDSGVKHGNEIARIPDATSRGTFDALQSALWERQPGVPPRLFDGDHVPPLSVVEDYLRLRPDRSKPPVALLGQVIDVAGSAAGVTLARTPGRNVAALGSVLRDATSVLAAATLSLSRQHLPGEARFTLVCVAEDARPPAEALACALKDTGNEVELVDVDGVRSCLDGIAADLATRAARGTGSTEPARPHYLVLYAIDAAYPLLEQKDPTTRASGIDSLKQILKHGPELATHTIGWWRSVQRLKGGFLGGGIEDLGAWVALDVHGPDLSSLAAGQLITWSPRPRRGLFFDRAEHARPEVVIPFNTTESGAEEQL